MRCSAVVSDETLLCMVIIEFLVYYSVPIVVYRRYMTVWEQYLLINDDSD
jgi:hypothetical protein